MVVVHSNGRESVGSVGNVGSVGKNYKYLHHYYVGLPRFSDRYGQNFTILRQQQSKIRYFFRT
ncbi:hypothetical protein [Hydrocoleum sp. CS-953]|uniref:hypothetical protein n=1 Tax=Hydrocoleum sp. CS-953 TaxID=1671698 RepID=UPI001AF027E0|nr:hypothetical protein [Hydrocoleum sp. CS-953]